MTYDTLEYNGTEKKFADWGFELQSVRGMKHCGTADTFEATIVTNDVASESASPTFPFEAQVIVRVNRTSTNGNPNTFTGGTTKFIGKCVKPAVAAVDGNRHRIRYEFHGPWYDLANTDYMQEFIGSSGTKFLLPETCMFTAFQAVSYSGETYGWLPISVGDQIQAVLQFILDAYTEQGMDAPFQYVGRTLYSGKIDYTVNASSTGTPGWDGTSTKDYNFYGQEFTNSTLYPNGNSLTIDKSLFNLFLPSLPAQKPSKCSEALNKCLQMSPRINVWFDYTTVDDAFVPLPTIHFSLVDTMPAKTLALFDGLSHKSLSITPRYDLQPRAVIVKYRFTNTIGGNQEINYIVDKYSQSGANVNLDGLGDNATDPNDGLRVVNELVDLSGFAITYQNGYMDVEPLACIGGTHANKLNWWKSRRGGEQPKFEDSRIRFQAFYNDGAGKNPQDKDWNWSNTTGGAVPVRTPYSSSTDCIIPNAKIYYAGAGYDGAGNDSAGNPVTPDSQGRYEFSAHDYSVFTYRIVRGTYQSWFKQGSTNILACKVKVVAPMKFAEYDQTTSATPADGDASDWKHHLIHYNNYEEVHVNLELTNAKPDNYPTNTRGYATFQIVASTTPSEVYPPGVAKYLYQHLSTLQYDGDFVKVKSSFENSADASYVTLGNKLNFDHSPWTGINAQIQSISEDYGMHETSLQIGVNNILSAGNIASLFNMWRFRRPWYNPALRTNNTIGGGGGQVQMAKTSGNANTAKGLNVMAQIKTTSKYTPES